MNGVPSPESLVPRGSRELPASSLESGGSSVRVRKREAAGSAGILPVPGGGNDQQDAGATGAPLGTRDSRLGTRFLARVVATRGAGFGLFVAAVAVVCALGAPLLAPYDPLAQDYGAVLQRPGGAHLLGADELGRDLLSRLIYGTQVSLEAGAISVALALAIGIPMGLPAGYFGGWVDDILMRVADAIWSFPSLILAMAITAILGPGLATAMAAIGVVFAPVIARLVRAQTLSVRENDYVLAARALGSGHLRTMAQHVWPNVTAPIIVQSSLLMAQAITIEAALSFLGLGVQPPRPAWGSMLRGAYQYMQVDPWLAVFSGAAIFVTVLAFNLLGDGLRRALDPRLRGAGAG